MDPELKKELELLRTEMAKNAEALARIDKVEEAASAGTASVATLQRELEAVKVAAGEREKTILELQRQGSVQRLEQDPLRDKGVALRTFAAIVRQELARTLKVEVPAAFKAEADLVRGYTEQLARASLSFNAASGSYLIPTALDSTPLDTMEAVSPVLGMTDFVPGLPNVGTLNIPTIVGEPTLTFGRTNTDAAMTQTNAAFGSFAVTPKEAYIYFPVDNNLLEMAALPLGSLLLSLINRAVTRGMTKTLLLGDGSAAYGLITGIMNEATYVTSLTAGKKTFGDLTYAEAVKIKKAVMQSGRANGKWLLAMDVEGACGEEDRNGKAPFMTFDAAGNASLLRNPVVNDELLPDLSTAVQAGAAFGAFGDLKAMLVGLVGGIRIASDASYRFGYNQTAFRAVALMDIVRKPINTLRTIKAAA